jgi:DNA-directed RNA polymerase subunit RPC12/RpoP
MGKGIIGFFFGRGKNEQKIEEYQHHTERSSVTEPRVIECSSCGAKNLIISNSVGECEYCSSPLIYIADAKTVPSAATAKTQNSDLSDSANAYTLTTGFYTAGIDIPVGTCNVTAISGGGNLLSTDYGINEVFGIERGYVPSFKGLKLAKDVSLIIRDRLTIKIAYKSVDGGFSGRTYDMSGAIDISTGNYIVGIDFEAGIYNIVAVSGSGNLFSSDADVNEIVGIEDGDVHEIKNVYFPKGAELSLGDDLLIKLIPAVTK